ncbi:ASCH domain-containing protein [Dethiosulfovibrio salsuginis]|uniref:Uncharacterized protein YhfF n=1 Tax=Dethiosulfovibrio salsuginis TaxID=561720 RepID=A0A1X7KA49_9BACT|nr:ASCH domain-containing protein [Dethiosulfovibrio salsuginis]SMG37230.1 Uncharacterized protein YhfF [Dethiosulfovibrio salsuginis]
MTQTHPSVREIWLNYMNQEGISETEAPAYESWYFCDNEADADELAQLVLDGVKRATASSLEAMEEGGEEIPKVGGFSVITDWEGVAKCIIRTEAIEIVPFREVTAQFAATEGEGDRSLEFWREVHRRFFTRELESVGLKFHEETPVICETFSVVYPPR